MGCRMMNFDVETTELSDQPVATMRSIGTHEERPKRQFGSEVICNLTFGLLLLLFVDSALAYTVNSCSEIWYPQQAPDQRDDQLSPERTAKCQERSINMKGAKLGEIEGKGYFITRSVDKLYACPRRRSGPLPKWSCMIPSPLSRNEVNETRRYYLLTHYGTDLRPIGENPGYATDGRVVLYFNTIITGADPATFQTFEPAGGNRQSRWALDRNHIYYEDTPAPSLVSSEIKFVGDFLLNDNRVFEVDDRAHKVKTRPDVQLPLTQLTTGEPPYRKSLVSDGQRIYSGTQAMEGLQADSFRMLSPVCPVPGHPYLGCEPVNLLSSAIFSLRIAQAGDDVLVFDSRNSYSRINNVPNFVFFQLPYSSEILGIDGHRLFSFRDGKMKERARDVAGLLFGPFAGAIADETGFIFTYGNLLCGEVSDLAWPERDGQSLFGRLRKLPDHQLPAGFTAGLENERFQYLFASKHITSERDTVIDKNDGRQMRANWCGSGILPSVGPLIPNS